VRAVRAAARIMLVLRQARLPVPPRLNQRAVPDPARPKNAYVREDQILPHLAALAILLAASAGISGPDSGGSAQVTGPADGAVLIDRLRADGVVLTYDPDGRILHAGGHDAPPVVIGKDATDSHSRHGRGKEDRLGKSEEREHLPRPEAKRG